MKKVLIVKEGRWGMVKPEEYEPIIDFLKRIIDRAEAVDFRSKGKEKAAEVRIVDTVQEADKIVMAEKIDVVVFISRSMGDRAERLAQIHPKIKVVVFTGLIPEGKVIWVNKAWAADSDTIQKIILNW